MFQHFLIFNRIFYNQYLKFYICISVILINTSLKRIIIN